MAEFIKCGEWLINPEHITTVGVTLDKVTVCVSEVNGEGNGVELTFRDERAEAFLRWLRNQRVTELW